MATVRDVMTAEPIVLQRDQSIADAARAMRDNAVGSVLVVDGDKLCGLVTDRDIVVRALAESAPVARRSAPCAARIWSRWTLATTRRRRCG